MAEIDVDLSIDPPRGARRVVAVGGSKGGVGKSLIALNLAVYLAQLGRRVVLVDADPTGANLHLHLGVSPSLGRGDAKGDVAIVSHVDAGAIIESALHETTVPGLRLLSAPIDASGSGTIKAARKDRLVHALRLRALADDVVVDVGPGVSTVACDLFLAADAGVLVTTPEPSAIETTYRFICACFLRDLRRSLRQERTRLRVFDRAMADLCPMIPGIGTPPPPPIDVVRHLLRVEPPIGEQAAMMLLRTRPRLVVNQTRVRTDVELGAWMAQIAQRRLGVAIDFLGHVEHDDAVWLATRKRVPLLVDNPSAKSGRSLERVARRLLSVTPQRARDRQSPVETSASLPSPPTHYERLAVTRGASEEELRRAFKRQREIYADGSLAVIGAFTADELAREHALLEEAHDTLLDPIHRRAYDVSVFPDHDGGPEPPSPVQRAESDAIATERIALEAALAREIGPETEFTGALLRRVREARGMELRELANKTKISAIQLQAIEDEALDQLPAPVYVRGFVVEIARQLRLDPAQVSRSYLRRARDLIELRRQ